MHPLQTASSSKNCTFGAWRFILRLERPIVAPLCCYARRDGRLTLIVCSSVVVASDPAAPG